MNLTARDSKESNMIVSLLANYLIRGFPEREEGQLPCLEPTGGLTAKVSCRLSTNLVKTIFQEPRPDGDR